MSPPVSSDDGLEEIQIGSPGRGSENFWGSACFLTMESETVYWAGFRDIRMVSLTGIRHGAPRAGYGLPLVLIFDLDFWVCFAGWARGCQDCWRLIGGSGAIN